MQTANLSPLSTYSRLLKSMAFTLIISTLAIAQAPAGPNRPAGVPADFVITPFGYFHPSCVNHLAKEEVLLRDESAIQRVDGTHEGIEECAYPHFEADGTKVVGDVRPTGNGKSEPPYIGHAWIEYASINTTGSGGANYGQVYAEWDVPPAPASNDGQTVYVFNGLEQYTSVITIVQPVLGWNADFSSAWGIAAWNCCAKGTVTEGTPVPVNVGDHVQGGVYFTCSAGTTSCSTWNVVIGDYQTHQESSLKTSSLGQTFNWGFGAVLEVYKITRCSDYPPVDSLGGIGFYNQVILDDQFKKINPAWTTTNVSGGLTPQCHYGVSLPKQVTLRY